MYSELLRIPIQWSGIPIFGVGALLAIWLIGGGGWMFQSGRRTGWSAETWAFLPGLALGALAIALAPRLFPDGLPIRGYGVMVLLGALAGIGLATVRARQVGLHPELIFSLTFWMFLSGILGARLFYVIEYWESRFQFNDWLTTLLAVVKFTEGGLVVYGSLIGATIAFLVFVVRYRLPALALADVIAPSLAVGLAFGRIGCLLNGCCYGGETSRPWAVTFPRESLTYIEQVADGRLVGLRLEERSKGDLDTNGLVIAEVETDSPAAVAGLIPGMKIVVLNGRAVENLAQAQESILVAFSSQRPLQIKTAAGKSFRLPVVEAPPRSRPVHPTQIYSAVNAGLLAWMLWSFYPFRRRDGQVIALMLTLYPISRFLLEIIRIDESAVFGTGLSISQNISLVLFVGAIAMWAFLRGQPEGQLAYQPTAA